MQLVDARRLTEDLECLLRLMRRLATSGQLSMPAAAVINRLAVDGPHRLTDLAAIEGASQPGMTQLISRLERDGLVRRGTDSSDGRAVVISVTAAGRRLAERRRGERVDALGRLVAELGAADQRALAAAMPALDRLAQLAQQTLASTHAAATSVTGARS